MVEIIGFGTMVGLVWLIAWSMAGESASEKRRVISTAANREEIEAFTPGKRGRHAA